MSDDELLSADDPSQPVEGALHEDLGGSQDTGGEAGGGSGEVFTDPELKDAGPPAATSPEGDPADQAGSSGAEKGINPWHPESYDSDPEGPTISTGD